MNEFEQGLLDFHKTFGMVYEESPVAFQPPELRELREELIREEFRELRDALDDGDIEQICKESTDLLYVVIGLMVTYGVPVTECFREIQRSNMSKLGEDGKPIYRSDGKVLKGPNYSEADMKQVLESVSLRGRAYQN